MFFLPQILEDLNKFNFKINEYVDSFGSQNIIYISKQWIEGSAEYKRDNLNTKYVKISDNSTDRQGYTISNAFTYDINYEIRNACRILTS